MQKSALPIYPEHFPRSGLEDPALEIDEYTKVLLVKIQKSSDQNYLFHQYKTHCPGE